MGDNKFNFQNILVIDFGQLGDVALSLSALKAVRDNFSTAHISVLSGKIPGEVINLSGVADNVITVDRVQLRDGPKLRSIGKILRLVANIRRLPIDLVIDLHSLPETNILAFLTRARHRLLANRESRSLDFLSNFRPKPPPEDKSMHLSERYLDVLKPLGIAVPATEFRLKPQMSDIEYINGRFFSETEKRTVGLFPGAGHPSRCWSLDNFAALAVRLQADGLRPAVFLGPEEKAMARRAGDIFPRGTIIIAGLSIPQFIAAATRLSAFVTNDTGPMHLAASAGAPVVLLLDAQAPTTYLPLTSSLEIVRNQSIDRIAVEDVYSSAMSSISKHAVENQSV